MSKVDVMCDEAKRIALDDTHGYDWDDRDGNPNYDCSGLAYGCAVFAKILDASVLLGTHYTGTIINHFTAVGYRCDAFDGNVYDLERGDLLLRDTSNGHVAIYIGNGKMVEANINEKGTVRGGKSGDQTGHEIHVTNVHANGWTHVLTPPDKFKVDSQTEAPNKNELITMLTKALEIAKGL